MPTAIKVGLWAGLAAIVGGAFLIMSARGSALLLDLAAAGRQMLCL